MIRSLFLLACLAVSLPALAKTPASPAAWSQQLLSQAQNAMAQGKTTDALDLYESAIAADPKNTAAYVGLGRGFEKIGMQGKALRYYRLALDINPNDLAALEAQAVGMLARGAPSKAQVSVDRIRKLCPKGCPALSRVDMALSKVAQRTSANNRLVSRAAAPVKRSVAR